MIFWLAQAGLLPVALVQGRYVRKKTPRLPEPPGERHGTVGQGPPLRVLIVGDSAAAGVGADSLEQALPGQLVPRLARRWTVEWRVHAKTGATTRTTLDSLSQLEAEGYRCDVALTSLGTNDVTSGALPGSYLRDQARLHSRLTKALGAQLVVVAGMPPISHFPALPQPLRWFLGSRGQRYDDALRSKIASDPKLEHLPLCGMGPISWMASDGFHPGPMVYATWAERAARVIAQRLENDR